MARLTDNLAALKVAMDRLFTLVGTVSTGKRKTAGTADKTKAVGGKDVSQLAAEIRKAADDHAALQGNVHNDTFTSVGIHSKDRWDSIEPTLMPKGIVPISRYGSQNYLPPGIQGSFEGGTTVMDGQTAIIIEDDGTVVYLRNGTDGASRGVYYAFLEDATTRMVQPTRTGRRYQPSWFPAGTEALFVMGSSQSAIIGQLQNVAGTPGDYFIALTNDTYDASKHSGGIIPKATGEAMGINAGCEVFVAGNVVYFMRIAIGSMASPFDVTLWSVPLATLTAAAGNTITFTQITGITTVGFRGVTYSALDRMRFAAKILSESAADNPMVRQVGSDFTFAQLFYYYPPTPVSAYDEASGKFRTRLYSDGRIVTTVGAPYSPVGFSFTYDPATKTARIDPHFNTVENTLNGNQPTPTYSGPLFDAATLDKLVIIGPYKKNFAFDEFGNVWAFTFTHLIDNLQAQLGTVANFTTKYAALEYGVAAISLRSTLAVRPSFGTAIGSNIWGAVFQSRTQLYLTADGAMRDGSWRRGMVKTTLEGDGTYVYDSLYHGTVKGYEPSLTRESFGDLGLTEVNYQSPVNEVSATGNYVTHTQRFFSAKSTEPTIKRLSGRKSISADLVLGDEITIDDAVMQGIGNQVATKVSATGIAATIGFVVDLIVPSSNGVPPFAIVMGYTDPKGSYIVLAPVTLSRDASGNITAATVEELNPIYVPYPSTTNQIYMTATSSSQCGPVAMYDNGTDVLIGITSPGFWGVPGSSPNPTVAVRYNKATKKFIHNSQYAYRPATVYSGGTGRHYVAHDVLGFGFCWNLQGSSGASDETTKLNFQPIGTTAAEFDAFNFALQPDSSTWTCLASQKAAEGWVVYFSEVTPVLINGYYYVLPVSTVDLRTIIADAANRTFYIYVRIVNGTAAYVIATSQTAESSTNMLVGTITTNSTQITAINAEKVSRLGNFRISATSRGSAIPVSSGLPSGSDKLNWS